MALTNHLTTGKIMVIIRKSDKRRHWKWKMSGMGGGGGANCYEEMEQEWRKPLISYRKFLKV